MLDFVGIFGFWWKLDFIDQSDENESNFLTFWYFKFQHGNLNWKFQFQLIQLNMMKLMILMKFFFGKLEINTESSINGWWVFGNTGDSPQDIMNHIMVVWNAWLCDKCGSITLRDVTHIGLNCCKRWGIQTSAPGRTFRIWNGH